MSLLSRIVSGIRRRSAASESDALTPIPMNEAFLEPLLRSHGHETVANHGWIQVPAVGIRLAAAVVQVLRNPQGYVAQLSLRVELPDGRTLVESCGGIGRAVASAITAAAKSMADQSYHVIDAAILGGEPHGLSIERWTVNGKLRAVTIGPIAFRGEASPIDPGGRDFKANFERFCERVQSHPLVGGTHWIRFYHLRSSLIVPVTEVLVDNVPDPDLQSWVANLDWPSPGALRSIRAFMIIQDA